MLVKLLMVFAEFERTSIINRVTQAYAHRSEMGFYMGGRRPYGFELIPTVIHNVNAPACAGILARCRNLQYRDGSEAPASYPTNPTAGDKRKKAVAMAMIHKIFISEDGSTKVLWNL